MYFNLWNADNNTNGKNFNDNPVTKTVYDPCPAGFTLPPSNAFTGFTTTGENVTNTVDKYNGEWNSKAYRDGTSTADQTRRKEPFSFL